MKAIHITKLYIILLCGCIIPLMFFNGCRGGDGEGSTHRSLETGVFIDSPVEGLNYNTETQSGTTDAEGLFKYYKGESVTFSIGDVVLGTGEAKGMMTPVDIVPDAIDEMDPTVTNICRFLQSLDEDGYIVNGITISPDIRQEVNGRPIDFSMSSIDFENSQDIINLFDALNTTNIFLDNTERKLQSASNAQSHMRVSIAREYTGDSIVEMLTDDIDTDAQPEALITGREWSGIQQSYVDTLISGNNRTAIDLYHRLSNESENLSFSPYIVSRVMAMAVAGARGQTEQQIMDAMDFGLENDLLHSAYNALDLSVQSEDSSRFFPPQGEVFETCAGAWAQTGYYLPISYFNSIAQNYGAVFLGLDFMTDQFSSISYLNNWISDNTNENISSLNFSATSLTRFIYANTYLMNSEWENPFDPSLTSEQYFEMTSGENILTPMMYQSGNFLYADLNNYTAIELPYKNCNLSMLILIPDSGKFYSFEETLDLNTVEYTIDNLLYTNINIYFPKFDSDLNVKLKNTLSALGITDAMEKSTADFSGINEVDGLYISDCSYKCNIKADETGLFSSGAASLTIEGDEELPDFYLTTEITAPDYGYTDFLVMADIPPEPVVEASVSRPFVYVIRDTKSRAILMIGKVLNPAAETAD